MLTNTKNPIIRLLALLSVFALLVVSSLVLTPARAADPLPEYLQLTKQVTPAVTQENPLVPGTEFTYEIRIICSEEDCLNAEMVDPFPAELAGFPVVGVSAYTSGKYEVLPTWSGGSQPEVLAADSQLIVNFGGADMSAGTTAFINVTLRVPDDYAETGGEAVGPFTNTATVSADNSAPSSGSADIWVAAEEIFSVAASKAWEPSSQKASPGMESTITIGATNTSNTTVEQLGVKEPKASTNGATGLDESNPFTVADLTSLTLGTVPATCTAITSQFYVNDGGTWNWVQGPAIPEAVSGAEIPLPGGEIGGVQLVCGDQVAPSAQLTADVTVAQRETVRGTGDLVAEQQRTIDNTIEAFVTDGAVTELAQASDDFSITPVEASVAITKSITAPEITAGEDAAMHIVATNGSEPVKEMVITDADFFTKDIQFTTITSVTFPAGATEATITYFYEDGTQAASPPFTPGAPVPSAQTGSTVTGFELTFVGEIEADARAVIDAGIHTTKDSAPVGGKTEVENTATVVVTPPVGAPAQDEATDDLTINYPGVDIKLDKLIRPGGPVENGEDVLVTLSSQTKAKTADTVVTEVVLSDPQLGQDGNPSTAGSDFWDAYDFKGIGSTSVPPQSELVVEVWVCSAPGMCAWEVLDSHTNASTQSFEYSWSDDDPSAGIALENVHGVKFTLTSLDQENGFSDTLNFDANFVTTARTELKSGGPTDSEELASEEGAPEPPQESTEYKNTAGATTTGRGPGEDPAIVTDEDDDSATGEIINYPGEPGPVDIRKAWTEGNPVVAMSATKDGTAGRATSQLRWSVEPGFEIVDIQDVAGQPDPPAVSETVFDAFNLVAIKPIRYWTSQSKPVSAEAINRYYMGFDKVTEILLFDGTEWKPAQGRTDFMNGNGFTGYELNAAERASTLAVKVRFEEDPDRRTEGAVYPVPALGTGVAADAPRLVDLEWEVRDYLRSAPETVVNENTIINMDQAGIANNVASLSACVNRDDEDCLTDQHGAAITIINNPPLVDVTKEFSKENPGAYPEYVYTPPSGADTMPVQQWTITGKNASLTKATHLQITDPALCDPLSAGTCALTGGPVNPFETFIASNPAPHMTIMGTESIANYFDYANITIDIENSETEVPGEEASEIDLAQSKLFILKYAEPSGPYTTEEIPLGNYLAEFGDVAPADMVGLSLLLVGHDGKNTISQNTLVTITLDTQLRETVRDSGEENVVLPGDVVSTTNRVFAQSFDMVNEPQATTGDEDEAEAKLTGGIFELNVGKEIDPNLLTEPNSDLPVNVKLLVDDGASTISPNLLEIEDSVVTTHEVDGSTSHSEQFWSRFNFVELGAVNLPEGSDTLRVDVFDGATWQFGVWTAHASGEVPVLNGRAAAVNSTAVQGIRFMIRTSEWDLFTHEIPTPDWTAEANFVMEKRDTVRGTDDPVLFDETEWTNTQRSKLFRADGNQTTYEHASDSIKLTAGTHSLAVNKLANNGKQNVTAGSQVPYTLSFKNTGTGYLTLTDVLEDVPENLEYTGDTAPAFETTSQTLTQPELAITPDGDLNFTWPSGQSNVLEPDAEFTIDLVLQLKGGSAQQVITNNVSIGTEEELSACTNLDQNFADDVVFDEDGNPSKCGTWDDIKLLAASNILTTKAVRGSLSTQESAGYTRPFDGTRCLSKFESEEDGDYYRGRCVAHSQHYYEDDGTQFGVDEWILNVSNVGSEAHDQIEIFDEFPVAGDTLLVDGKTRGSEFRPQLVEAPELVTDHPNATITVEATLDDSACLRTWSALKVPTDNAPVCDSNGASWIASDQISDWTLVKAYRMKIVFAQGDYFEPGQNIQVTLKTKNQIAQDGASNAIPVSDQVAINQFGATFRDVGDTMRYPIAESFVGVHLMSGSIEIRKEVDGPAADYATQEFLMDVTCTLGGQELDTSAVSPVVLNEDNGFTHRLSGIPVGSHCLVAEQGEVGEFGEATRSGDEVTLEVAQPDPFGEVETDIPVGQLAVITNTYTFGQLFVEKAIDSPVNVGQEAGPYSFELVCAPFNGVDIPHQTFELMAGETWSSPANVIPVGAQCSVSETGVGASFQTTVVTSSGERDFAVEGDQSPTGTLAVAQEEEPATAQFINSYLGGSLEVAKLVTGTPAAGLGAGPFQIAASCTLNDQLIYQATVTVGAGDTALFQTDNGEQAVFPAGTLCDLTETDAGGATSSQIPTQVVIAGGETAAEVPVNTVNVTNDFRVGSAQVEKLFNGPFAQQGKEFSYQAAIECTYQRAGEQVNYLWGTQEQLIVDLTEQGSYRHQIDGLPVGASCEIFSEVDKHGATAVEFSEAVNIEAEGLAQLSLTNTFNVDLLPDTQEPTDQNPNQLPQTGFGLTGWLAGMVLLGIGGTIALAAARQRRSAPQDTNMR